MKITFLGTGSVHGIPVWNCNCSTCLSDDPKDKRLRCSLLVEIDGTIIVIDFGPDFRHQLLKYNVKKIDYAFLTHAHGDHMNGYHELACQKNIVFETGREVLEEFSIRLGSSKNWLTKRNPSMTVGVFSGKEIGDFKVDLIRMRHDKDYSLDPVHSCGYLFSSPTFTFAYLTDYAWIVNEKMLEEIDLIISDSSGLKPGKGHPGIEGALELFHRVKPKRMLLTHVNHSLKHTEILHHLKNEPAVDVAFDGMIIEC